MKCGIVGWCWRIGSRNAIMCSMLCQFPSSFFACFWRFRFLPELSQRHSTELSLLQATQEEPQRLRGFHGGCKQQRVSPLEMTTHQLFNSSTCYFLQPHPRTHLQEYSSSFSTPFCTFFVITCLITVLLLPPFSFLMLFLSFSSPSPPSSFNVEAMAMVTSPPSSAYILQLMNGKSHTNHALGHFASPEFQGSLWLFTWQGWGF